MNFGKIRLVAGREYSIRVKKKSFIFTTILTPILFAALMVIPSAVMLMGGDDEVRKVMVLDLHLPILNLWTMRCLKVCR